MVSTLLTKKALNIMFNAHKEQIDKSGVPYVFHPYYVAEKMDDEYSTVVALLHDVVEDTDITFETLEQEFPSEVIDALKLLTHEENIDYFEYIYEIKNNELAKKVKINDLLHNMDISRMNTLTECDLNRIEKYKKALKILKEN